MGHQVLERRSKNYMTQQMAPYVDEFIENRMGGFGVKNLKSKCKTCNDCSTYG